MKSKLMLILALGILAGAGKAFSVEVIRFDFAASPLEAVLKESALILKGTPEQRDDSQREIPFESTPNITQMGDSLRLRLERPYLRPGERWIEARLALKPVADLGKARIVAKLFKIAEQTPLATTSVVPSRKRGWVFVDLRSMNLPAAMVSLELFEGSERTGAAQMFVTARPCETPLTPTERIPVTLDMPKGIDAVEGWPVTFGVPFPAGALWDANLLRLVDKEGKAIPCQVVASGLWAREGAVKWARFDALVSSAGRCFVVVGSGEKALPKTPLTLTEKDGRIVIDTGVSTFVLGKGISPIMEVIFGGKQVATAEKTRGLYVVDQTGRTASASAEDETMIVESRGPVASCVRFEGYYRTAEGEPLARHITRVEAFAGQPFAKVTHTLVLCNSTTSCWFKDIGWEFAVEPGQNAQASFGISRSDWQKSVSQPLNDKTPSAYMVQDEHYYFAHGTNHFAARALDGQGKATTLAQGDECGDWGAISGSSGALALACRDTALQHPKEFEVLSIRIILHLFSNRAGEELDFRPSTLVEKWNLREWYKKTVDRNYQPRIDAMAENVKKMSSDAIGWAKTHDLFVMPLPSGDTAARMAYLNCREVLALVSPQWTHKSGAFGPLHPKDTQRFPEAEKYIDATFRLWEKRIADWGDYGFMYYYTGPHLSYAGKYAMPERYSYMHAYTLRSDLWRAYVRSGDRTIRELAEKSARTFGDNLVTHWEGNGKVKGLFHWTGGGRPDTKDSLPFHWEGTPTMDIGCDTDLNNFLYLYYVTGNRRAKDIVDEYAEGIKRFWTPARAKSAERYIMAMRLMVQAHGQDWDPALREMAEATTDILADEAGEVGLSKDGPYRDTLNKALSDIVVFFDAWETLGTPRYYSLARKLSDQLWGRWLGEWPVFYVNNQGRIGSFLYDETGNAAYAEMLALQARQAASGYDTETGTAIGGADGRLAGAEDSTFVFQGIPYSQDLMARTGADKKGVASWVAYSDYGFPSSIVAYKSDYGILDIDVRTDAQPEGLSVAGAVGGWALRPVGISTTSGLGLNRVTQKSRGVARIHVPKDAPEGAYEVLVPRDGFRIAVAGAQVPMVVHAPDYWRPEPRQAPPIKWYFSVPADSQDAQIFFENGARLYDPDGKPWPPLKSGQAVAPPAGTTVKNWVDLPPDKPGLWAFEPSHEKPAQGSVGLVRVKNIPPFFAAREPKSYFAPPIAWAREKPYKPTEKPADGTVYVTGTIQTPDNQALYLDAKRTFTLGRGSPHASGDGSQFLPFKQGTIEFFFKPAWTTFDLPAAASKEIVLVTTESDGTWPLRYNKARKWWDSHVLRSDIFSDGPFGRYYLRTSRQMIFAADEWIHLAWVWGQKETPQYGHKTPVSSLTAKIYVNGKSGNMWSDYYRGNLPANMPTSLVLGSIEAAYDELRVSDIQRYTADFTPPSRDKELPLEEHTRALFHFNGNAQGESYGQTALVPGTVKER